MERPDVEMRHEPSPSPSPSSTAKGESTSRSDDPRPEVETFPGARAAATPERSAGVPRRVAVVGCSSGGRPPLQAFLETLGPRAGAAIVLLEDDAPERASDLPEFLRTCSTLPLRMAVD